MTCGIYRIEIEEYFYIGSSKNVEKRIKDHLKKLKNCSHNNKFLLNVYSKHFNKFSYFILEECEQLKLEETERFWMKLYYNLPWNMNLSTNCGWKNGSPMEGRFHTEQTKQKLREINGTSKKTKTFLESRKEKQERLLKYLKFGHLRKDWWNITSSDNTILEKTTAS